MFVLPCLLLGFSALVLAITTAEPQVGILGLLGGNSDISGPSASSGRSHSTLSILKPFTTSTANPSSKPTPSTSQSSTKQFTFIPWTDSAELTAVNTILPSTPSVHPASAESHATDPSSRTWEAIGIVTIAILFIAASITFALFFDPLCTFLKAVMCCRSRLVSQQLTLDCEKQSWDARTFSPSPSKLIYYRAEPLRQEKAGRTHKLPWNTDSQDWNALCPQPSRGNDRTVTA